MDRWPAPSPQPALAALQRLAVPVGGLVVSSLAVGTMSGHGFYDHEDDDGFHFAACVCGWQGPPVPDVEDAADTYGDHRAAQAVITTANVIRKAGSG